MNTRVGFGTRFGAWILDLIIIGILVFLLGPAIGGAIGAGAGAATGDTAQDAALGGLLGGFAGMMVALPVITILYALLEAFTGMTLGKMILGIKVGRETGQEGDLGVYFKRYIIKNIGNIIVMIAGFAAIEALTTIGGLISLVMFLGCFLVLGEAKQALHDKLAKTAIYKRKELAAGEITQGAEQTV